MKKLIVVILLFCSGAVLAEKKDLSGIISDEKTGETLIGASVSLCDYPNKGTTTNANGFFTLPNIEQDSICLRFSFIGYETQVQWYDLKNKQDYFLEVQLHESTIDIEEISVVAHEFDRIGDKDVEISEHRLSPNEIKLIPSARKDVFRSMRFMPGIQPTEPLSPLVSIRGGDPGENLIMLDGVTMYNPYHFLSSSGIFNMQTVKNVDVLAGGFGAEFGGRNSSVINILTKDGNRDGLHGEITPTTSETSFFLEFPAGKKSTMMVAGRVHYDLIGNFILYSRNYFYDLNFSCTTRLNQTNWLTWKVFGSHDKTNLDFSSVYKYIGNSTNMEEYFNDMSLRWTHRWNNHIGAVIWKSALSPKLFLKAQTYISIHNGSNYSEMSMRINNMIFNTSSNFKSGVRDISAIVNLEYKPFYWSEFKAGMTHKIYFFSNNSELNKVNYGSVVNNPQLFSFFAENKVSMGALVVRPGLRVAKFENNRYMLEPRFNAVLNLPNGFKLQAAWGKYLQYIVSMNTQDIELNQFLDYYYPLGDGKDPSLSYHYMFGAEKKINFQNTLSIDFYYKNIARAYTFDLLHDQYEVSRFSDRIAAGHGCSYGAELMWKGSFNKFSGWASYGLSRSTRSFPHIMNGQEYDYDYDRRHSIKFVMTYQASKRISYSTSFVAQSGTPRSIENSLQLFYMYDPLTGKINYSPQYINDQKNSVRMPWSVYLDLGLRKDVVSGFGKDLSDFFHASDSYMTVNVYNALFFYRNIIYYIPISGITKMITLGDNYFPIISAGYTIKF